MKIEQIKPGHTYYAPVEVVKIANGDVHVLPIQVYQPEELADSPNPLRLVHADEKPKYDPCRLFKKGDKVRVVEWNGRDIARVGQIGYVVSDEHNSRVELSIDGWTKDVFYPACHLELVTPVEELEPYRVETGGYNRFRIKKGNLEYSYFPFGEHCVLSMDEAKAAAEAECARLNDEYRNNKR